MAKELGFCDTCGYTVSSGSTDTSSVKFVMNYEHLGQLIADGYHEAALGNNNMRTATELLEGLRRAIADEPDYHQVWDTLDEHIGRALDKQLRQVLMSLRKRFVRFIREGEISRLSAALRKDPEGGWSEWLRTYCEALVNWRIDLGLALCEATLPFPATRRPTVEMFHRSTELVADERWGETFDMYRDLGEQEVVPALHRARLLVVAGEIELFQFRRSDKAKDLFVAALKLAPEDWRATQGMGEYWLQQNQIERAREQARQVLAKAPESSQGHVLMGECDEQRGDSNAAEQSYQEGIRTAPGESGAYSKLLRLYGQPELFSKNESRLLPLRETGAAIEPLNEYSLCLDMGASYQQNGRYAEAYAWYEQAVALNDRRLGAYTAKGYSYLEQENYDQARAMFEKAIELAPEAVDGYWGMSLLYEQQEKWEEAIEAYEQSLKRRPEMDAMIRGLIAQDKLKLKRYDEVKQELIEVLRREPENETVLNPLNNLADIYYKSLDNVPAALWIYEKTREIKGEAYEGNYQNLVGNLKYYWGDNDAAIEAYRAAIAAEPNVAVYHSNLAGAYQGLKRWDEARQEFEAAGQIDKQEGNNYHQQIAAVWNLEGNDDFAQGQFQEAGKKYQKAIDFDATKPVYYSNLSLAWENLKPATEKLAALDNAITAIRQAIELDREDQNYASKLASLEGQRKLAAKYGSHVIDKVPLVTPLAVEVASNLIPYVEGSERGISAELMKLTEELRKLIFNTFGISVPGIRFRGNEGDLPAGSYIIMLMEVPIVMGTISPEKRLFPGSAMKLIELGVTAEATTHPLTGDEACWVQQENCDVIKAAGLEVWSLLEYPIRHLEAVIRRNLSEFVDHQEVIGLLATDGVEAYSEVRESPEKLTAFVTVLRALVTEEVPITPLDQICRTFCESLGAGLDLTAIVEGTRSLPDLRPKLPGNNNNYTLYRLGPQFMAQIEQSIRTEQEHRFLAMEPEKCQQALAAVRDKVASQAGIALWVEQPALRPFVRRLTEIEFPGIPVLSRQELLPELTGQMAGEIDLT